MTGNAAALGPLSSAQADGGPDPRRVRRELPTWRCSTRTTPSPVNKLKVGSTVTVAKTSFKVVGIVSQPAASNPPDVYIPLARAQALGTSAGKSLKGDVNTIYVPPTARRTSPACPRQISAQLPGTTVTNQTDLASQLTGSVSSAASLASNLGKWLAIAVLVAAFLLASLLTMSAVSRRVREFGTLKALGWTSRRVVGQVMGEALAIGIVGGIIGVGLGFLGSALVGHFAPPLTAAVGPTTGSATPGGARTFGGGGFRLAAAVAAFPAAAASAAVRRCAAPTVHVHLSAPVTAGADRGGGAAGDRRRPDRRRLRRLARGPAAARGGAGDGSNERGT